MTTRPVSGNQSFTSVHNIPGQIPELNVPIVTASQVDAAMFGGGNLTLDGTLRFGTNNHGHVVLTADKPGVATDYTIPQANAALTISRA